METVWIWALGLLGLLGCLSAAGLLLLALLLKRPQYQQEAAQSLAAQTQANMALLTDRLEQLNLAQERQAKDLRQELLQQLTMFQQTLLHQSAETTRTQNAQIDAFGQQLALMRANLSDTLAQQINAMSEANARRLGEMRATLEAQLTQLQQTNATKLDEMRATVDEKLHATLQARLGESFKQVADRLEQVHKGLGEMQTLATGVATSNTCSPT